MQSCEGSLNMPSLECMLFLRTRKLILYIFIIIASCTIAQRLRLPQTGNKIISHNRKREDHKLSPSLTNIIPIDVAGRFTVTSLSIQHRSDSKWYIPHYHDKHSAGWNRTVSCFIISLSIQWLFDDPENLFTYLAFGRSTINNDYYNCHCVDQSINIICRIS